MSLIQDTATYAPVHDNLFAGTQVQPVVADAITLTAGQGALAVGSVLGKNSTTGAYTLCDSDSDDGSEEVAAILAMNVDTGAAPGTAVVGTAYFTGEFNSNAVIFGGTDTAADHASDPRVGVSIFFKENAGA